MAFVIVVSATAGAMAQESKQTPTLDGAVAALVDDLSTWATGVAVLRGARTSRWNDWSQLIYVYAWLDSGDPRDVAQKCLRAITVARQHAPTQMNEYDLGRNLRVIFNTPGRSWTCTYWVRGPWMPIPGVVVAAASG